MTHSSCGKCFILIAFCYHLKVSRTMKVLNVTLSPFTQPVQDGYIMYKTYKQGKGWHCCSAFKPADKEWGGIVVLPSSRHLCSNLELVLWDRGVMT